MNMYHDAFSSLSLSLARGARNYSSLIYSFHAVITGSVLLLSDKNQDDAKRDGLKVTNRKGGHDRKHANTSRSELFRAYIESRPVILSKAMTEVETFVCGRAKVYFFFFAN